MNDKQLDETLVLLKFASLAAKLALSYSRDARNPRLALNDIAMLGTIASAIGQDVPFYGDDLDTLTTAHQRVVGHHKDIYPELAQALASYQVSKGWPAPFAEDWNDPKMDVYDEL